MSCLTVFGRKRLTGGGRGERLPFSSPPRTEGKVRRLREYAASGDAGERAAAASNPGTPVDALEALVRDEDVAVRRWAARNPALPEDLMRLMLSDEDAGIRAYARTRVDWRI